jgi:hypothetical protein
MHITSSGYDVTRIVHTVNPVIHHLPFPLKILRSAQSGLHNFHTAPTITTSSRSIWPGTCPYVRSYPLRPISSNISTKNKNVTNDKNENVANDSENLLSPDYMYRLMYQPSVVSKRPSLFKIHR